MQYRKYTSGQFKTRSSYGVSVLEDEDVIEVPFPTEYFCAPQFYYKDQKRFAVKPKQLQAAISGVMLIPIPMSLPKLNKQQEKYAAYLKNAYRIDNVYLLKDEILKLKREATSTVSDKRKVPSRDIFHEKHRQTLLEAEKRLNSKKFS